MIRWLRQRWYARCRALDLKLLWPSCRTNARDVDHARAAFAMHAFSDPAWQSLGEAGIADIIDGLE